MDHSKPNQDLAAVELSLIPGVGSVMQGSLWKSCPRLDKLFQMSRPELEALGAPAESATAISTRRYRSMAEETIDWATRENCRLLIRGTPDYPCLLEEIYDPPLVLYCRGQHSVLALPAVAIVGTRRPTYYGLQMAQGLAFDLAKRGITIVSGLARGIDAAAHRGCLEGNGRTAAVLGCGIDVVYPREHRQLSQNIAKDGLLLSEFPPGTSPAPRASSEQDKSPSRGSPAAQKRSTGPRRRRPQYGRSRRLRSRPLDRAYHCDRASRRAVTE